MKKPLVSRAIQATAIAAAAAFVMIAELGLAQSTQEASGASTGTLEIELSGFETSKGDVKVALYNEAAADEFPDGFKKAQRFIKMRIKDKRAFLSISKLPYGVYAVSAFHDEDGDGQLGTGLFGIPTEAVGASRNPGGKPDFEDSRFQLNSPRYRIKISLSTVF